MKLGLEVVGAAMRSQLLAGSVPTLAGSALSSGDVAILKFLAAAELIEADLWQQYAELGGATTGPQNAYQLALQNLDGDGSQYISSNNENERSHASFLNAYLIAKARSRLTWIGSAFCRAVKLPAPANRPPDQSHAA